MASYHLSVKSISRSKGYSATAAAAYRAREAIYDDRTGQLFDYSRMKNRALFTGIFVPQDAPEWAHDREKLWNAAERAETDFNRKKNAARVAQDITVALPHEMTDQQRQWLVTDFVREQFQRKGYAVDVAIHEPHEQGDKRNYHAHILIAERVLTHDGFAPEKDRALKDVRLVDKWREDFARLTNRHLERHGIDARVDHRSLDAQGITDREPPLHMGKDAMAAERKGHRTERGERAEAIKDRNAERQQIREDIKTIEQEQKRDRPQNVTAGLIHDARYASDGAKAFAAAMAERGLTLAQVKDADLETVNKGRPQDWRPMEAGAYVALNKGGYVYELTESNTGLTRGDRADWLKDLDGTLASVTETQAALAADHEAEREAWRQARAEERAQAEAERRAQYVERRSAELASNPTVQEIGLAYAQTSTGPAFVAVLEERGLWLAQVTREDAERSQTQRDYGRRAPALEAGEYVVLNEHGHTFKLDGTTIYDEEHSIFARLAEIDASEQLTLSQARQVVAHRREAPEPAQEAPAQRVKETARSVARGAEMVTDIAGSWLGGAVRVTESVLGALTDFFTAPSNPTPTREARQEPPRERTERVTPQQRERLNRTPPEVAKRDPEVQQQARSGNISNMPLEIQEAIRRRARQIEDERRDREHSRDRER